MRACPHGYRWRQTGDGSCCCFLLHLPSLAGSCHWSGELWGLSNWNRVDSMVLLELERMNLKLKARYVRTYYRSVVCWKKVVWSLALF